MGKTDGRYVTWDDVRKLAIAYERQGECKRCGRCCYDHIKIWSSGNGKKEPTDGFFKESVTYEFPSSGDERTFFGIEEVDITGTACYNLDGCACNLHDNGYPPICQAWPVSPDHQILWPDCGFDFAEVERWAWDDELVLAEDG